MDRQAVLAAFDEQIRRRAGGGQQVERDGDVIRTIGRDWRGVTWSGLDERGADAAIAAQIERLTGPWEWKHYSYDEPADLPDRLLAAGFTPEPPEALLVAEIAGLALDPAPPAGVRLEPVVDERGIEALVRVHDEVFGGDHSAVGEVVRAGLEHDTVAAVIAVAGATPISAGRVVFNHGTEFAGLWGGGTLEAWRGRGVFRSLVAHRAALAAERGFRYLQVDASADSRPILQRLGFAELATTTPFIHP